MDLHLEYPVTLRIKDRRRNPLRRQRRIEDEANAANGDNLRRSSHSNSAKVSPSSLTRESTIKGRCTYHREVFEFFVFLCSICHNFFIRYIFNISISIFFKYVMVDYFIPICPFIVLLGDLSNFCFIVYYFGAFSYFASVLLFIPSFSNNIWKCKIKCFLLLESFSVHFFQFHYIFNVICAGYTTPLVPDILLL